MLRAFVAIFFACTVALSAHAQSGYFFTGNDLAKQLADFRKAEREDKEADFSRAWKFRAYIIGVHDTASGIFFCPPEGVDDAQIAAIVAKFLEDHPEQWDKPAWSLVGAALSEPFPCKERESATRSAVPE